MQSSAVYQVCVFVVCSVCSGKFNVQHLQKCWCLRGKTVDTPHLPASFNGVGVGRKLLAIAAKQPLLVFVFDTLDVWFFATPLISSATSLHFEFGFTRFIYLKKWFQWMHSMNICAYLFLHSRSSTPTSCYLNETFQNSWPCNQELFSLSNCKLNLIRASWSCMPYCLSDGSSVSKYLKIDICSGLLVGWLFKSQKSPAHQSRLPQR